MIRDFQGKNAFITGAASGIGLAMAKAFAAKGMTVAVADIQAEVIEPAVEAIKAAGGKQAVHLQNDLLFIVGVASGKEFRSPCGYLRLNRQARPMKRHIKV